VISRHDYHPFGEEISTTQRTNHPEYGGDRVRKQFTGYERDKETELDFAQARYYAKELGRFNSADPVLITKERLADPQRVNVYAYVRNSPLKFTDPLGLDLVAGAKTLRQARETFRIFQLGLEKSERKYTKLVVGNGKNGFARGEFGITVDKNHQSQSGNFQSVQKIANDAERSVVRFTEKTEDISKTTYIGVTDKNGTVVATQFDQYMKSLETGGGTSFVLKNSEGGGATLFPMTNKMVDGNLYTKENSIQILVAPDGTDAEKARNMYHEFSHDSESDMGRALPLGLHGTDPNMTNGPGTKGRDRDAEDEALKNSKNL
jgi:RHS repeat-associated protein